MKAGHLSIPLLLISGIYLTTPETKEQTMNLEHTDEIIQSHNDTVIKDSDALVNYSYFKELVDEVEIHRSEHLITLDEFLKRSRRTNTVILDTRSKAMYDLKHVKGAIHLNFSDFTMQELEKLFGQFDGNETEILIYCNNNFYDSKAVEEITPAEFIFQDLAFVSKSSMPIDFTIQDEKILFDNQYTLALNIPTYINLFGYGYKNVYELNELVDVHDPRISFEGTFNEETTN